jgi:DNA-binding GntR family transcriptional regulator
VARQTKKDRIVEELRRLLTTGEIERGARMHQDELAQRFDASITPVREALRQLEAEGLLESEPRRGVRVATVDLERLKGTYIARRLIEPYAAERAALRVSRRDLASLRSLCNAMADASEQGDEERVRDTNRRFHFELYERSGIPSLTRLVEGLWLSWPWDILHVLESRVEASIVEHREIVDAVESGELPAVRIAMDAHLTQSYLSLARHIGDSEHVADPFDVNVD